ELSEAVADLEPDHKGVPVLLRQYLNVGGQILDFNVDRDISEVLDALIVVDLAKTSERLLERSLGKEGAARFRGLHGAISSSRRPRVSSMNAAASIPTTLDPANIRNTDPMPPAPTMI